MNTLNRRSWRIPLILLLSNGSSGWRQLVFVWLLSIAVDGAAWAAESTAPVQAAAVPVRIALRAGKLLNVRTGDVTTNVVILVEGDTIAALGGTLPAWRKPSVVNGVDLTGCD